MESGTAPLSVMFTAAVDRYRSAVVQSDLPSTSPKFQETVMSLIDEFRAVWSRFQQSGAFSSNDDTLDDLSVATIRYLAVPYYIGDLYQRVHQVPADVHTERDNIAREGSEKARCKILAVSEHFFGEFLNTMVQIHLVEERVVETQTKYEANSRNSRIARSREMSELQKELADLDKNVSYDLVKRRRLMQLAAEDGEEFTEATVLDEELLRKREVTFLRWCILDAISQLQLSSREMDMIGRLDEAQKRQIVQNYQAGIQLFREGKNDKGRNTYTILPGGLITPGMLPPQGAQAFREQVRAEVFMERNRPTMTLEEFAQNEMAEIQRQMEAQSAAEAAQKEEDARLGDEGIEERERVKQSRWDDWRDENPPIGITTKGNYS